MGEKAGEGKDWGGPVIKLRSSARLGKAHLVAEVAAGPQVSRKEAAAMVEALIEAVLAGAKKGSVSLPGLGTFGLMTTKARAGVRSGTNTRIEIPAMKRLRFKASRAAKRTL